jgi:serine/threonine protein kinase
MPLTAGTRLGPYEITAPLGRGGMGEVYRARDTRLGREVAVKVLPDHLSAQPEVRARFEREAKTVSSLSHPHICTLFDVGRHAETEYLVMELVDGESLAQRLERGPLPTSEVLRLGAQIADALGRAHRAGVVHRDLKPGNVMLSKGGAKLMDFGLARAVVEPVATPSGESATLLMQSPTAARPLTAQGTIIGTFQYMSPEQLEGKDADRRSDLWALGCVLYEMATGTRAFTAKSQASLIASIMQAEPRPMMELSPLTPAGLERLVKQCLVKEPDERWQDAHDLALELAWLREGAAPPVTAAVSAGTAVLPTFRPVTFRRGTVNNARFLPDGHTVVYSASWGGAAERVYMVRTESNDSTELPLPSASLLAVSRQSDLALSVGRVYLRGWGDTSGTLARAPLFGGGARELLEAVHDADWAPDGRAMAVIRKQGTSFHLEYPIGRKLHESITWMKSPRVSPDGQRVAFIEYFQSAGNLVRLVEPGGEVRTLVPLQHWPGSLAWSADGRQLFYSEWGGKDGSLIASISLDGMQREITRLPGTLDLLDVSASGDLLIATIMMTFTTGVFVAGEERERDLSWLDMGLAKDLSVDGARLLMDEQGTGVGSDPQVFLRDVAGGPPIHLGAGVARALSPDGKWALVEVGTQTTLLPTGSGQPRAIDTPGITTSRISSWFPDSQRLLVQGSAAGRPPRLYEVPISGGPIRPLTPEGCAFPVGPLVKPVSQDGRRVFALAASSDLRVFDVESGAEVGARKLEPGEEPVRWHADGRSIFTWTPGEFPAVVRRVAIDTTEREDWRTLMPADPTGVSSTRFLVLTPDGNTCAASYIKILSQLHVMRGMS